MSRYKSHKIDGVSHKEHVLVWEAAHGQIPPGYDVHHIDGNGNNNELSNLQLLSHGDHMRLHAKMRAEGTDPVRDTMPGVLAHRESVKKYRRTHLEKVKAREKAHRAEHHDEIIVRERERYVANRERIRESQRQYELRHKAERAARNAAYQAEHSEERKEYHKSYRAEHSEEISAKRKAYYEQNADAIRAKAAAMRAERRAYLAAKQRLYVARRDKKSAEVIAQCEARVAEEKAKLTFKQ